MVRIRKSDLDVFPIQLGGNVFGWTADEAASFDILDAFVGGGGNFVDSADVYSAWNPGTSGGDSETILGNWMAARGNRRDILIATKGGARAEHPGSSRNNIRKAVEGSLSRLKSDYIDLYYIHKDDLEIPLEETVDVLNELVTSGKVRHVAASNFSPERLTVALEIAEKANVAAFVALQPPYSLVNRAVYEGALESVVSEHGLSTLTYSSLAGGFLSGKYRDGITVNSPRLDSASKYLDDRGRVLLDALDEIASTHNVEVGTVALAWIRQRPSIAAPIASAGRVEQVAALLAAGTLDLDSSEIERLNSVTAPA